MGAYQYLEKRAEAFPRKRFLGVAGFQVAVGILFIVLAVADLSSNIVNMGDCYNDYEYEDDVMDYEPEIADSGDYMEDRAMSARSFGPRRWGGICDGQTIAVYFGSDAGVILCCIFYLIAGGLGLGAARTPLAHRKSGLKTGFMVISILNALLFGLMFISAGINVAMFTAYPMEGYAMDYYWKMAFGCLVAMFGFAVWILSIVSAAMACCCAPVEEIQYVIVPQQVASIPCPLVAEKHTEA